MSYARQQTLPRIEALDRALRAAAANPQDAEAIHDARVAARRLLQCLRVFATVFDEAACRKIRKRLRKLLDRCAAVRNCDVTLELLAKARFSKQSKVATAIGRQRRDAERGLAQHLERWRGRKILDSWPRRLFATEAEAPAPDFLALTQELFAEGHAAAAPDSTHEAMHRFRLLAKRYRYTVEVFQPQLDAGAVGVVLSALRGLQERLGSMNDCVTALDLLQGHPRAVQAVERLLAKRTRAFRAHWRKNFGDRRQEYPGKEPWTSIFYATAKPNRAPRPRRKPAAGSPPPAAAMSAAS